MPNYHVPTGYFIDWSKAAVNRLRTATIADVKTRRSEADKIKSGDNTRIASRFQNAQHYFRAGVTFSDSGVYSPSFRRGSDSVFDQKGSIIVPNNKADRDYILAIESSIWARYIYKNFVNHSISSHVDSIKEMVFLHETNGKFQLQSLVAAIVEKQKADPRYPYHLHEQREIDTLVYQLYGLTADDIREVTLWYCRRYHTLAAAQGVTAQAHTDYETYLDRAAQILNKPASHWRSHPLLTRIAGGETHKLDLKETLAVDRWGAPERNGGKAVARAVAAFLNADGGEVVLGVTDSGRVVGLDRDMAHVSRHNEDGFQLKVREILGSLLNPAPRGNITITFVPLPEGTVCVISVAPTPGTTYFDGKVYVRDGNRTIELMGRDLVEWLERRQRGGQ